MLRNLKQILDLAVKKDTKTIVVAAADDNVVLSAIMEAIGLKLVHAVLVGNKSKILQLIDQYHYKLEKIEIIDSMNELTCCKLAIDAANEIPHAILMKGDIPTNVLLKHYLQHANNAPGNPFLSHIAISELIGFEKLLFYTDCALNISPDINQKVAILNNALKIMYKLGYNKPKVAIIAPSEMVNPKIESTVHAAMLTMMNKRRQISGCEVDGPLSVDNAIDNQAATRKGIISKVVGDADLLLMPDLNAGNVFYKSLNFISKATTAAIITGGKSPIVLTSRADSSTNKLYSIALAVATSN